MRRSTHILSLLFIAFVCLLGCNSAKADLALLELRSQCLVGNELRLIVETYRTWTPVAAHSSKTSDVKSYLVTIDLSSDKKLLERSKIYGPLWNVPNTRSSISFSAGVNFTKQDEDAAAATPGMLFGEDGELLRFKFDLASKSLQRHSLELKEKSASWKLLGDVKQGDDRQGHMSENRCRTNSDRYKVFYQDGNATCVDCFTGEIIQDEWLTTCFIEVRNIKDFSNVRQFLTDDRQHLIASPMATWNNGKIHIESFDYQGKTYKRSEFGLAYSRPNKAAQLFPRQMINNDFLGEPPHAAISIAGELFLLQVSKSALRLYTPDQRQEYVVKATEKPRWVDTSNPQYQFNPATKELILHGAITKYSSVEEVYAGVTRWPYEKNNVDQADFLLNELFEKREGLLYPKQAIAVE